MKRRASTIAVLVTLFFLGGIVLSSSVSAHDEELIIVDKQGGGDYNTIQQAIAHASAGSTIVIRPGEYAEILRINKKISLIGEDREQTIINPISEPNKYVILLGAPDITIQGLSISNGAPGLYSTGIRINAPNCNINDCLFYDNPIGIAIWASGNQITNCLFQRCEDEGIAILGSKTSPCDNNKITHCIFSQNCDGIELQHSSDNLIKDCDFYQNTHTGIDAIASGNDRNIIQNCHIYDNHVNGIYLSASSDNQIIDCTVTNNRDGDIVMNKYAKNNQIISLADNEKDTDAQKEGDEKTVNISSVPIERPVKEEGTIVSNIITAISQLNIQRFFSLFAFNTL